MSTPFFLRPKKYIDVAVRATKEAQAQAMINKANNEAEYKKPKSDKSLFGKAVKAAAGFIPDPVEDKVLKPAAKGLEVWGNQVAGTSAALFTEGQVRDGQYTTKRNLIGNPFSNIQSHVAAQREAGIDTGTGLVAGFKAANRAGKAFNEDPDINPAIKTTAGILGDPTSFAAAGIVSKLPKVAAIGGAKGSLLRTGLGIAEGFDSPAQLAKFTVGAAAGTYLGDKVGHPNIGGILGGGLTTLGKPQGLKNNVTEIVKDTDRLEHGTHHIIRKGEIVSSPKGDIGAGHYVGKSGDDQANFYVTGDLSANVTGFPSDYVDEMKAKIDTQGGQQIYRYRPTRDLLMLQWEKPIDQVEASRINNVLKKRELKHRVSEGMTGEDVYNSFGDNEINPNGNTSNKVGVLNEAGWDGMTNGSQYTIWRPNEVLEADLTPPENQVAKPKVSGKAPANFTNPQLAKMAELQNNYPNMSYGDIVDYMILHTDSYGDTIPGHPQFGESVSTTALADNEKVKKTLPDVTQVHGPDTYMQEYEKELSTFSPAEKKAFNDWLHSDSEVDTISYYLEENGGDPGLLGTLKEYKKKYGNGSYAPYGAGGQYKGLNKPAGGIPDESVLNPKFVDNVKTQGYIGENFKKGLAPVDFTQSGYDEWVYKDAEKVLDWASANGHLNDDGMKQLDDVLKKMDELEPNKNAEVGAFLGTKWLDSLDNISKKKMLEFKANDLQLDYMRELEDAYPNINPDMILFWASGNLDKGGFTKAKADGGVTFAQFMENGHGKGWQELEGDKLPKKSLPDIEPGDIAAGLTPAQVELVKKLKQNLPGEKMETLVESVKNGTSPSGIWHSQAKAAEANKPKVAPIGKAIQPTTPEEIIGNLDKKDKSVDEFVQEIESNLGKPYDKKSYAAPGEEGSPVTGTVKSKGSIKPYKENGIWYGGMFSNEDLGDLMDELTKAGYKTESPFFGKNISGGAAPESLVKAKEVGVGLTLGEKIGNQFTKVKKFILDHGVENNATATPIAKEYLRINNIVKNQATNIAKLAHRFEHLAGVKNIEEIDVSKLSPEAKSYMDRLNVAYDAYDETLTQFGTEFKDIQDFWAALKDEQGYENKKFGDIVAEYGNAIANKVSDKWLQTKLKELGLDIDNATEAGMKIPGRTVNIAGAGDIKLPREIADVINNAVHKVHPPKSPEAYQLFQAVNNTLRGVWAAGDLSRTFIQQLPLWADNPKRASASFMASLKAMKDPTITAEWVKRHDELRAGTTKPTVTEYLRNGLHQAEATGEGTDLGGLPGRVQRAPLGVGAFLRKTNAAFTEGGNIDRIQIADMLWDNYESGGASMMTGLFTKAGKAITSESKRAEVIEAISRAANRSTGYADKGFGGPLGSALFFAPRFMQSQLETVVKAAWGMDIESQVARRQLTKLIGIGAGITVAINELNGEDTDFDPRSSNFMRIKNVMGADISVFGPWDTLVKGVIRSVPHIDDSGDWTLGEPQYLLRSKLSPVLSTAVDRISGENVIGQDTSGMDMTQLKNLLLPFSLRKGSNDPRDWSIEGAAQGAIGFLGAKGTPLSPNEVLDNKLSDAGIKKSDPEYLIKRKEYLAEHPEIVPQADKGSYKRSQEIQVDIKNRRQENADKTTRNEQSLVDFRENRKDLLEDQRARLDEVIKGDIKKANSKQQKWINSYFKLFESKDVQDPIFGLNPDKFDAAVAAWMNTDGNGTEAMDFVNRFMGAGLNPVEKAYNNDLRKLDAAGYFDTKKYRNMKSDLNEDTIDRLAAQVDAYRVAHPKESGAAWSVTARKVLKESLDSTEILDIINSRKDAFTNPERKKLKDEFAKETLWFNSRANWDSYENYQPGKKPVGKSSTGLLKPNIGGALKGKLTAPI